MTQENLNSSIGAMSIPAEWFRGIHNTATPGERTRANENEYLSKEVREQREWTILHNPGFLRQASSAAYENNWDKVGTVGSLRGDLPGTRRHSWAYQRRLSDMRRAVWYNSTINAVLISYRGTNAGGWNSKGGTGDVLADLAIGMDMSSLTPMYREDDRHYERVKAAFPGATIEVTGHSLGGHRASAIGAAKHVRSSGFNEGSKPPIPIGNMTGWLYNTMFGKKDSEHRCYRVTGDVVSMGANITKSCQTADVETQGVLHAHTGAMSDAFGLPDALRICNRVDGAGQKCI